MLTQVRVLLFSVSVEVSQFFLLRSALFRRLLRFSRRHFCTKTAISFAVYNYIFIFYNNTFPHVSDEQHTIEVCSVTRHTGSAAS